jgi:hypothetical protein
VATVTTTILNKVLLHACARCHGDLFLDLEDEQYSCLQCGREYAAARIEAVATIDGVLAAKMTPYRAAVRLVSAAAEEWNDDAA